MVIEQKEHSAVGLRIPRLHKYAVLLGGPHIGLDDGIEGEPMLKHPIDPAHELKMMPMVGGPYIPIQIWCVLRPSHRNSLELIREHTRERVDLDIFVDGGPRFEAQSVMPERIVHEDLEVDWVGGAGAGLQIVVQPGMQVFVDVCYQATPRWSGRMQTVVLALVVVSFQDLAGWGLLEFQLLAKVPFFEVLDPEHDILDLYANTMAANNRSMYSIISHKQVDLWEVLLELGLS